VEPPTGNVIKDVEGRDKLLQRGCLFDVELDLHV